MTEHIDIEVLADYSEALLDPAASARVSRHLDECASCTERLTELGDVSTYLSALPPPPMPPEVATRIETAIANEARVRSSLSAPTGAAGAAVIPFRSRSRRWIAPLTVAAAAVVVVGGGYGILRQVTGGSPPGASAPARTSTTSTQELPKAAAPDMMNSGTRYTTDALGTQVNSMMEKSKSGTGADRPKTGRETPPPSMSADLAGCVDRITGKVGSGPLLVDSGTYEGDPVKVLVFRKAATPSRYDVWIVGADCSAASDGVVSHTSVARHP
ncbi:MAG: hypothetical protein J2P40_11830 [Candidatus Dormibacteraeota bacterium]|nr:hypothetical protein [Candidatus Dormibacteraeota bacterium]MBO0761954.1 hypothetical protein [Candidatus Dormibacteraeota bacterium]